MSSEGSEQPDIPEGIMFSPRRAADLHHDAVVSRALQQELARIDELHGGPLNKNFGVEDLFDLLVAQLAAYGKHVDALRPRVLEQADRGGHDDEELKKLFVSIGQVSQAIYELELSLLHRQ
jgi:hypothetical protein